MAAIDLGLEGKRVLVTGASRGIGAAAARAFAEAGCRLALHWHSEPAEAAAIAGASPCCRATSRSWPTSAAWWPRPWRRWAGSTCWSTMPATCSAAIPLAEMDDAAIDRVFDLNARSVVAACRAALPALCRAAAAASST